MYRLGGTVFVALLTVLFVPVGRAADPHFRESLFYAYQGHWFDALERLDAELLQHQRLDEPELDTLYPVIDDAKFSTGDFELNYRMHHRAGRAVRAVLEGDVAPEVRNEAAYRLARIQFQKNQPLAALVSLARVQDPLPALEQDVTFLRANALLVSGQSAEASTVLKSLQGQRRHSGFSEFNLAVAHLQQGDHALAMKALARAGSITPRDDAQRAVRDKANLAYGTLLAESGSHAPAKVALDKVRLSGPFSNEALLRSGWAAVSLSRYERAIVPWQMLSERNATDPAVQEALLTLPYAFAQMGAHGRAANLYARALDTYAAELNRLHQSVDAIRAGGFLQALKRPEMHADGDWLVRLRELPTAPETYYLTQLLASHEFHTALANYLDLEDLRSRLERSHQAFGAYGDVISARRDYYEPLLPGVDARFRDLAARRKLRIEQYAHLQRRFDRLLTNPRPEMLATASEQQAMKRLSVVEQSVTHDPEALERARRLRGLITWRMATEFHDRLSTYYGHLAEARVALDTMNVTYRAFVATRQSAEHGFRGQAQRVSRVATRVTAAHDRVVLLIARQGQVLEQLALAALDARIAQLDDYQQQARFALAHSYDRAVTASTSGRQVP